MSELTITRSQLRQITLESIACLRGEGIRVPRELERNVKRVAATAPAVLIAGWWNDDIGCGCLIGTIFKDRVSDLMEEDDFDVEYELGCRFDRRLHRELGLESPLVAANLEARRVEVIESP